MSALQFLDAPLRLEPPFYLSADAEQIARQSGDKAAELVMSFATFAADDTACEALNTALCRACEVFLGSDDGEEVVN